VVLTATPFNVWWFGEVPPCRMLKFSTKACGGILPNHCYVLGGLSALNLI